MLRDTFMQRRRRTLVLLALIPTALAAGGIGYWWHTSTTHAPTGEDPIALLLGAPTTDDVALDQLTLAPTPPSYEDVHHPMAASSELITLSTDDSTWSASEYPTTETEQLDGDAFVAMAFDAGSSSGAAGYDSAGAGNRGGGGRAGGGAGGGGSSKPHDDSSVNHQQSTAPRDQTFNPVATDEPVAFDDVEADNERDAKPRSEPLVQVPPRDHTGPCFQLWCSQPHYGDRPESGSPPDQYAYSPVNPDPVRHDDEIAAKPQVSVPEPGSLGLLSVGLLGLLAGRRRPLAVSRGV
ncbi:MAG: PEP-CTERM sorting domain-containing protein [Steroidobacteraceae bacterium]